MANSSLLINQGTNSAVNFDLVSGTNTQVIAVGYGTISTIGTLPTVGSITNIGSISTIGTMPSISANPSSGTLDLLKAGTITKLEGGTLNNLASGTINSATVTGNVGISSGTISVLPNLPQGSIQITAGTITEGTLRNLISGTI
jgi:hypothetical protein